MPEAALPPNESKRLESLRALRILDSAPDEEFDALVKTAAIICDVPICAISLVDSDRQWFKAITGLPQATQTARSAAFCAYTICDDVMLEVPDALLDARFSDNELVLDGPKIRFYAGVPLKLSDGSNVGALCVIDTRPRLLESHQKQALNYLSIAVVKALERRFASQELIRSQALSIQYMEMVPMMSHSINSEGRIVFVNTLWLESLGYKRQEVLGHLITEFYTPDSQQRARNEVLPTLFNTGRIDNVPYQMVCKSGKLLDVLITAVMEKDQFGNSNSVSLIENITGRLEAQREERSLFNAVQSQFIMSILDLEGNYVDVNDTFCTISGYSREELIGQNDAMLKSGEHPDWFFDEIMQKIQSGLSCRCDIRYKSKSGDLYWGDCIIAPIFNNQRKIDRYIILSIDVTEWIEQNSFIQKNAERMMLATNSGGIGVWEFDLLSDQLVWEGWMFRLYGLANVTTLGAYELWDDASGSEPQQEEVTVNSQLWKEFIHPDDLVRVELELQDAILDKSNFNTEFRIIWRDGSVHHLRSTAVVEHDNASNAIRMVGASWDVTELRELSGKLAEHAEQLKSSEERFNLAVLGANDGLWDRNIELGTVYYSPRWKSMLGYEEHELENSGELWNQLVHPDDKLRVARSVEATIKSNTDRFNDEYRMRHKDGHYVWILDRGLILRGKNGDVTRFIGFHTDISEHKQVEKLKSEFISTVSHELRTPLTSISAALGLLNAGMLGALPVKAHELVNIAHKNSLRLATLVNDILDMEKLLSGKVIFNTDDIDMVELIRQSVSMNADYALKFGTRYELTEPAGAMHVIGDRDRLMQVMANLMSNAAKFNGAGSAVQIRVRRDDRVVKVEVQDHGPGIPLEFRNRIFGEFAQANSGDTRQQGGTGLGLNITKKLVSRMGGEIGYETELGLGSVFWFTLPVFEAVEIQGLFQM